MSRAGVEALRLLWCDVGELRHTILLAVCGRGVSGWFGAAAHLPALDWLPFCAGSRARDRAGAATASRGAASRCLARRTVDSLVAQASLCTLGCPPSCETGSWVPSGNDTEAGHRSLHGSTGTGRGAGSASVRVLAQIGSRGFWLSAGRRRAPHRARNRVDAAAPDPIYGRAKSRAERQRGSCGHCCQALGQPYKAICDAARLHQTPP